MVPIQPVDYIFLTYLRYFSTLIFNISSSESPYSRSIFSDLENYSVNLSLLLSDHQNENCTATSTKNYKCELISQSCPKNNISIPSAHDLEFVWHFNTSKKDPPIFKRGFGTNFQLFKINSTIKNHSMICCEIFLSTKNYSFGPECVGVNVNVDIVDHANEQNITESHHPVPVPHINLHAGLIQCRSAVIMWKSFENSSKSVVPDNDPELLEYYLEYKLSKLDWKTATNISIRKSQNVVVVDGLEPWSKYYFRVTTIHKSGAAFPSTPIIVVTPEDSPSGPVEHVMVSIVDDQTLLVKWKPPPRSTWNGALLGYNIGYKRLNVHEDFASSGEDTDKEDEEKRTSKDSYSFIVLTSVELLGRLCEHEISVPDSRTPYEVVVQAYNNVGRGPLSIPVLSRE